MPHSRIGLASCGSKCAKKMKHVPFISATLTRAAMARSRSRAAMAMSLYSCHSTRNRFGRKARHMVPVGNKPRHKQIFWHQLSDRSIQLSQGCSAAAHQSLTRSMHLMNSPFVAFYLPRMDYSTEYWKPPAVVTNVEAHDALRKACQQDAK